MRTLLMLLLHINFSTFLNSLVVDETKTFSYIDIEQFYVVPNNVTALYVKACGAQGEGVNLAEVVVVAWYATLALRLLKRFLFMLVVTMVTMEGVMQVHLVQKVVEILMFDKMGHT
jgi:hypothetical protein